jgi:hypothetical protein
VSWNGATEVASWQLHAGRSADRLEAALVRPRTGFETALPAPADAGYAAVVALDRRGNPLGRTAALRV